MADEEEGGTTADKVFFLVTSFASSAVLFVVLRCAALLDCNVFNTRTPWYIHVNAVFNGSKTTLQINSMAR